jgi:hypothetical protein
MRRHGTARCFAAYGGPTFDFAADGSPLPERHRALTLTLSKTAISFERAVPNRTGRSVAATNGTAGKDAAAKPEETVGMTRWIVSAWLLALTATPVAAADVRLDSWRNPKNENFASSIACTWMA